MKKMGMGFLTICLLAVLLLLPLQVNAEAYGVIRNDSQISTGPGDQYSLIPEMVLQHGEPVKVRTKSYDGKQTWVQVEFTFDGAKVRGYVRSADVKAELRQVPAEAPLCTARILSTEGFVVTGPYYQGYLAYEGSVWVSTNAIVYEVEDGSAFIEYWDHDLVRKCRSWVLLSDLETERAFACSGYYGVAEETSLYVPSPTHAPSTYYGSVTQGYPVGMMCTVVSGSCHVKRGPGTDYETVNYAHVGDRYEVLECQAGSTGKDWYRIKISGAYGWISSGLVSLD